ncbi:MAG: alpha/beta fold hydrolase [Usitatibacter sp.]
MRLPFPIRLAFAAAALATAGLAMAATSNVSKSGFLVTHRGEVKANPPALYAAIAQVGKWWSPAHTYSGDAAKLAMDPRAGGCFCETWGANSVQHARVIQAQPGKMLRLEGSLGPLQEMAVHGVMTFTIDQEGGKTALTLAYRVRGAPDAALDKLAPAVDKMIGEQFLRLVDFAGGAPAAGESAAAAIADQYFDSNGVRIRYIEDGKTGDPVILVHDFASRIEDQWIKTGVMPTLATQFRVVAFDARGHGKSDKPHDPKQYGAEMGLDVIRLMDHLGIQRAHIVGYAMGANIVAQLVTTHPERFITMTLGGATGRRNWTAEDDRRAEAEAAEIESAERLAGQDPKALAAVRRSNRDQVVTDEQMAAVKVPTLGIVGTKDPNMGDFVRLKPLMPRLVRMVAIADATHATAPAAPEFVAAIEYFLGYHPARVVK